VPTVFRDGPYRFFFFSNEGNEPVHIHIEAGSSYAKFWLEPVVVARSIGFRPHELAECRSIIEENADKIRAKWNEHFRDA
jgi:hypothetical protein